MRATLAAARSQQWSKYDHQIKTIGVLAPLFPPATLGGGPIRTLDALVAAAPDNYAVSVVTSDHDLGGRTPLGVRGGRWARRDNADIFYCRTKSTGGVVAGLRALRSRRPDVLYINGFFNPWFSILPQLLWRLGFWGRVTRLVAPRGEFGAGALGRRTLKKRTFISLYRLLRLHRRVVWHASTELEAADIRAVWGAGARVVVRENETFLPDRPRPPDERTADGPLRLVFLGRLAVTKGLHIAIKALQEIRGVVQLDVYGPAEHESYVAECRALIAGLPANVTVRMRGAVNPQATLDTLAPYHALLMPTVGENFGHVIAESLSVSLPVLSGPRTPWTDLLQDGGGEVLELEPAIWQQAIQRRGDAPTEERLAARRAAGHAYEAWRARPAAPHVFELLEAFLF